MKNLIILLAFAFFLVSCQGNGNKENMDKEGGNSFVAEEIIQTSNYTYIKTSEKKKEKWFAIPKTDIQTGKTYYYQGGYEMLDFEGKEANKTFEKITFLDGLSETPLLETSKEETMPMHGDMSSPQGNKPNLSKENVAIEPVKGGITVAELYKNKKKYDGKTVKIKGQVTHYNEAIMDRNWIHIQDGSEYDGKFDVTATSQEKVKVGETLTLEGKIILDKDFGYGYFYEVLLTDAKIIQ